MDIGFHWNLVFRLTNSNSRTWEAHAGAVGVKLRGDMFSRKLVLVVEIFHNLIPPHPFVLSFSLLDVLCDPTFLLIFSKIF